MDEQAVREILSKLAGSDGKPLTPEAISAVAVEDDWVAVVLENGGAPD